jgi:hypothetical protein
MSPTPVPLERCHKIPFDRVAEYQADPAAYFRRAFGEDLQTGDCVLLRVTIDSLTDGVCACVCCLLLALHAKTASPL